MTEKLKDRLTGWLVSLVLTFLTLIAAGVGWLIVQNNTRIVNLEANDKVQDISLQDLKNISSNLIEAYNGKYEKDKEQDLKNKEQDDEILELWKCTNRGTKNLTLKQ